MKSMLNNSLLSTLAGVLLVIIAGGGAQVEAMHHQPTHKFMGWYGAPGLSATDPLSNFTEWAQNGNNAYINRWPSEIVKAQHLFPHLNQNLLALEDDYITVVTNSQGKRVLTLVPQWKEYLKHQAPLYEELLRNGTIVGFFLGDELMWNCFPYDELVEWSNMIRDTFPAAFLWENEAEPVYKVPSGGREPNCSAPGGIYAGGCCVSGLPLNISSKSSIPPALNVTSIDLYAWDPKENKDLLSRLQSYYDQFLKPRLHEGQKLFVVPGADASNYNPACNFTCYDTECSENAAAFAKWIRSDELLAGAVPWTWNSCGDGCEKFKDEIGCQFMPKTKKAWREAGSEIMSLEL